MIPRFQGKAYEVEGGWQYDLYVSIMGEGEPFVTVTSKYIFKTREEALADMRIGIKDICQELAKLYSDMISHMEFVDMQTNETRKWDKTDEH